MERDAYLWDRTIRSMRELREAIHVHRRASNIDAGAARLVHLVLLCRLGEHGGRRAWHGNDLTRSTWLLSVVHGFSILGLLLLLLWFGGRLRKEVFPHGGHKPFGLPPGPGGVRVRPKG